MLPRRNEKKARFIKAVRAAPFLYDCRDNDYKNKIKFEEKWEELAKDYNYKDAKEAKSTWNKIKTAYNRSKVANLSGKAQKKPYVYATELSFLDDIKDAIPTAFDARPLTFDEATIMDLLGNGHQHKVVAPKGNSNLKRFQISLMKLVTKLKSKEKRSGEVDHKLMEIISSVGKSLTNKESVGEVFGHAVAIALGEMPTTARTEAQLEIQRILNKYNG